MGNTTCGVTEQKPSAINKIREDNFRENEEEIIQRSVDNCATDTSYLDINNTGEESSVDDTDSGACELDPSLYKYPFENLVFEGGGNKGLAYCGSVKCLEEMNIMPQIKRVGGSSAGAITAALVALGFNSTDIAKFMSEDLRGIFLDHSYGYLSLLPNLIRGWGWNPGHRIYKWLGDRIRIKTGNPDYSFSQLYKEKGIELCVVVTNLNQMRAEYCHPKTTPNMPIRSALRMSISIPVVFMACVHDNHGQNDTYVDGGVLNNFPVQCFDGWFLSMENKDAFLIHMQKLDNLSEWFSIKSKFQNRDGLLNKKTVGFLLYDSTENDVMKDKLETRKDAVKPKTPKKATTLYRKRITDKKIQKDLREERQRCQHAAEAFMQALLKYNIEDVHNIDREELRQTLEDEKILSAENKEILFGKNISVDEAFDHLDKDRNGHIDVQELLRFLETRNIRMQTRIQGYARTKIVSIIDFVSALQNSWTTNMKHIHTGAADIKRTVGINTGHVSTSDYVLEDEDREFLFDRGYNATMAFLRYFIDDNPELIVKIDPADSEKSVHDKSADLSQDTENVTKA